MYSSGESECVFGDMSSITLDESLQTIILIAADGQISSSLTSNDFIEGFLLNMISTYSSSSISSSVAFLKTHGNTRVGFSTQKRLKCSKWSLGDSEKSVGNICLLGNVGLSHQAEFALNTIDLTFEATVPVRVPDIREVRACQNSVGIFYKYCFVNLRGSIFNPPSLFLIEPLQLSIDEALRRVSGSDSLDKYSLLSKVRDSLIFFVHETKPSKDQYFFPKFFKYPHIASRNSSLDATTRVSPSLVSPSLPGELVQFEFFINETTRTILFVPSISGGVAHIVSDDFVAFSTESEYWKLYRSGQDQPESVSLSCPPTDSQSESIVVFFKRMQSLINHNDRIVGRMALAIPPTVPARSEFYSQIGSFHLSESGHVSCVFRDRVRLSFQLSGTSIDREYGSVVFLTPSGETEELTWNFLLGNRHEGFEEYEFYVSCALRFVYNSLKPLGVTEPVDSFDESEINHVLDNTIKMIELIRG